MPGPSSPDLHRRISEALDDLLSYVNQEWWNCTGGSITHAEIERKRTEIENLRAAWEQNGGVTVKITSVNISNPGPKDRRAVDRITNRKVICGHPLKVEHYGGGRRYHCPACDVRTENGLKMAGWINATPPEDRICHKEKK